MRSRFLLLVLAILLVAGFAALNWSEVTRPAPLLFGPVVMDAPLGAILLGVLAVALVIFVVSNAAMRTQTLLETRNHHKTLETQRALAEKAEASRFTELRTQMDNHLREMRERDAIAATEYDKAMVQTQRELRTQMEQMSRMISARMNELEHRLESRFERMGLPSVPLTTPVRTEAMATPVNPVGPVVNPVNTDLTREREHAMAREAELRAEQERNEERLRNERIREREVRNEERVRGADKPSESGWRRWF